MVQGQSYTQKPTIGADERDQAAKRAGFESMQKKEKERNQANTSDKKTTDSAGNGKYGAWGPVFKNRENFNSMHFC